MMKQFIKDYKELCGATGNFYKKHWFGCILMNLVTFGGFAVYLKGHKIKAKLKAKFHKNKKES